MDEFKFEDGFISARELAKRVTAYKEAALQTALENGCQSVPAVMAFMARRAAAGAARQRAASRAAHHRGSKLRFSGSPS